MGHIAIRLNPGDLANPDLDVRYRIPDLVEEATAGRVQDNGFDYADDTLIVYLRCADPASELDVVIKTLRENEVCGNRLLEAAVIGISNDHRTFKIVHPLESSGEFTVRPW